MQTIFAVLSLILGFATFVPYFVEMAKGTAKPHIFSWITWSLLTGLGFVISLAGGGGEGAWIFGLQSALCIVVAIYAFFRGEKNITRLDRFSFAGALVATIVYVFTKNAVISVCLAAMIDCLGFVPTFRKSYAQPFSEPALTFLLSGLGFLFSVGALDDRSFVTMFYPLVLVAANASFVLFLLTRRSVLKQTT